MIKRLIAILSFFGASVAFADGATVQQYMGSGVPAQSAQFSGETLATGITALGNSVQADAYTLKASVNIVTVVTSSANGVKLPITSAVPRGNITILNADSADTLKVYPQTGKVINSEPVNAPLLVSPGGSLELKRRDGIENWIAYGTLIITPTATATPTATPTP